MQKNKQKVAARDLAVKEAAQVRGVGEVGAPILLGWQCLTSSNMQAGLLWLTHRLSCARLCACRRPPRLPRWWTQG